MLKFILALLCISISLNLAAQEEQGLIHSNYSGIRSYRYNPADIHNKNINMEFNLVSGNLFAYNDYLYLDKQNFEFGELFKKDPQFTRRGNYLSYSFGDENPKNAYVDFSVLGPSFLINFGDNSLGFHTGLRGTFSMDELPYSVAQFMYRGSSYNPLHDSTFSSSEWSASGMAWAEMGVTYAHQWRISPDEVFTGGFGINYLKGLAGGYLYSQSLEYQVPVKDSLIIYDLDGELGYSLPVNYESNEPEILSDDRVFKGSGISFNMGFTYQKTSLVRSKGSINRFCRVYDYKIGIAFTDVGSIKFKDKARQYVFNNSSTQWDGYYDYSYNGLNHLDSVINTIFAPVPIRKGIDEAQGEEDNHLRSYLPSAFRAYADFNLNKNWFINANAVLALTQSELGVRRPNQIAVVPRYETRMFEMAFPVYLYDLNQARFGLSLRIWDISIGTDDISSILGDNQLNEGGFYFSIKYSITREGCKRQWPGIFDAF